MGVISGAPKATPSEKDFKISCMDPSPSSSTLLAVLKLLVVPLLFGAAKSFLDVDSTMANNGEPKTGINCWCGVFSDTPEKHPKIAENGMKIAALFLDLMADTSGELQSIENPKPGMQHFHNAFQAFKAKHHECAQANTGKMLPRKGKDHTTQVNGCFL